jgi:phosphoglucosamine mutase
MTHKKYFGTDGIRGRSNKFPMTAEVALRVGMAVGAKFTCPIKAQKSSQNHDFRHRVVIGKDTRLSGYLIESALTAGFASVGMDVFLVGPVPTPAISMLARSLRADIGIMISASHNLYNDNGIKIFDNIGHKLDDATELEIEGLIDGDLTKFLSKPEDLGRVKRLEDAKGRYIEFVKNSFPKNKNLSGLKIVIDCANGSAYSIAPMILRELGAEIFAIGVEPDGFNINDKCGSTDTKKLSEKVLETGADIGIALDGDADRLAIVDQNGRLIDGDFLIALIAEKLHFDGRLKKDTVVATEMSNIALENHLSYHGISLVRANIGDRYVIEEMKKGGYNFGAEQSGHIILSDYSTTGDGLIAGLQVLSILASQDKKISELVYLYKPYPQISQNIPFEKVGKNPLENNEIKEFIKKKKESLSDNYRLLVRKSGTENLIRVMVEGEDEDIARKVLGEISSEILLFLKTQNL